MNSQYQIIDLFDIEKGSLQSSKCVEGEYDFITASSEWKTNETFTHDCEALVFAMGAAGSLGRTHYVNGKFIASDLCFILTPKTDYLEKIDLKFYYYYFNSNRQTIVKLLATGTTKLAINQTRFSNYQIPYFDLTTQKKLKLIYDKVSVLNAELVKKINKQEIYISKLRQSILQQAVEGKLCPQDPNDEPASELLKRIKAEKEQLVKDGKIKKEKALPPVKDDEKPFALPQGWEWCHLSNVGNLNRGKSKHRPRNDASLYRDGIYPFIQTGDIAQGKQYIRSYKYKYNDFGLSQSKMWQKGTLCITIAANIASTGILEFDACFPDSVVGFQTYLPEMDVVYFKWIIDVTKNELEKFAPATAQKNINLEILNNIYIPLPPLSEQQRIVKKVNNLMSYCDELETQVLKSKAYADSLMQSVLAKAFNDKKEKQPTVIVAIPTQVKTMPIKLAARGSISAETMQHIEQTINEMCGES